MSDGEQAAEFGQFTVSVIEESERSDQVFALVSFETSSSSSVSYGVKKKAAGENPRNGS